MNTSTAPLTYLNWTANCSDKARIVFNTIKQYAEVRGLQGAQETDASLSMAITIKSHYYENLESVLKQCILMKINPYDVQIRLHQSEASKMTLHIHITY